MRQILLLSVFGSICPLSGAVNLAQSSTYLYRTVSGGLGKHENMLFSPYSILTQLSMTQQGAMMSTRDEMDTLLPPKESFDLRSLEEKDPEDNESVQVQTLSLNYAPKHMERDPMFSAFLKKQSYVKRCKFCEWRRVDFTNPAAAAQAMNAFVKEKTEGRIEDMVDVSALSESTQLMLLNALLFRAPWQVPFNQETVEGTFRGITSEGEQMQTVQFLNRIFSEDQYAFEREPGLEVVCLKYADPRLRFCLFLPDNFQEFEESTLYQPNYLERKLMYVTEASPRHKRQLSLELPQFKLSAEKHRLDFSPILQRLGLKKMFTEGYADFSRMTSNREEVFVSSFLHQTEFAVTAAGTEGSACRDVVEPVASRLIQVKVDKPFFFTVAFVDGKKPPNFLLLGRVVNLEGNQMSDMQQQEKTKLRQRQE